MRLSGHDTDVSLAATLYRLLFLHPAASPRLDPRLPRPAVNAATRIVFDAIVRKTPIQAAP